MNPAGTAPVTSTSSREAVASFLGRLLLNIISPQDGMSRRTGRNDPRPLKISTRRALGFLQSREDGRTVPKESRDEKDEDSRDSTGPPLSPPKKKSIFDNDNESSVDSTEQQFFEIPAKPNNGNSDDDDKPATKSYVEDDSEYDDDDQPATKSFSADLDEVNSNVTAEESKSDGNVEDV
jgi:hypothetical protein